MNIQLNNWMSGVPDDKKLFELTIPGTHDSVTEYVQFAHISQCQDLNISDQLDIGIRALDLRVEPIGNRLGMVHSVAKAFNNPGRNANQMDMHDVLLRCYDFLKAHPSETIIIQFKNDNNKENEKSFDNLVNSYIKGNEDKWYLENRVPTLGECRGKIVLIRRCDMDAENEAYTPQNTGIDFSNWVEQDEAIPDALQLETNGIDEAVFIIQDRFKYKPEPRWDECIEPFLNDRTAFNGEYIICYTSTAGGTKGPKANSSYINQKLMEYTLDKSKYYGTIYLDFPFNDLTRKLIEHNYK